MPTPTHWPKNSDWIEHLSEAFGSESFQSLMAFVENERESQTVFPPSNDVFAAFRFSPFSQTKVVLLGQDPYHGDGQAHGLSFSVKDGIKHPPSLRNIFKELESDVGATKPESGNLSPWANQGVLLLNTVLTVRKGEANSHRKKGWEKFTDAVIRSLNNHPNRLVFILWGSPAHKKEKLIDSKHGLIKSVHPSPLSAHRGFFGSCPFSQTNESLIESGQTPIDWQLPN